MGLSARFADLLEYPGSDLVRRLEACRAERPPAEAVGALLRFEAEAARLGPGRLEEAYTSAFDMDASCALSAGHHLFGESGRRSVFLCRLAAEYRENAFARPPGEPPDSLTLVLRYVDADPADPVRRELLAELVLPAARRLSEALGRRGHPYAPVLEALVTALAPICRETPGVLPEEATV